MGSRGRRLRTPWAERHSTLRRPGLGHPGMVPGLLPDLWLITVGARHQGSERQTGIHLPPLGPQCPHPIKSRPLRVIGLPPASLFSTTPSTINKTDPCVAPPYPCLLPTDSRRRRARRRTSGPGADLEAFSLNMLVTRADGSSAPPASRPGTGPNVRACCSSRTRQDYRSDERSVNSRVKLTCLTTV